MRMLSVWGLLLLALSVYGGVDCLQGETGQWPHKDNVTLARTAEGMRADVAIGKNDYGWFRFPLPKCDYAKIHGVRMRIRVLEGRSGSLFVNFVLFRDKVQYYGKTVSSLASLGREWQELYVPIAEVRENGNRNGVNGGLSGKMLTDGDDLQLIVQNLQANAALEIGQLELVMADEAPAELARLSSLGVRRMLKKDVAATHPRLLLHGEKLAAIRAKAQAGGKEQAGYETLVRWADHYMENFDEKAPFAKVLAFRNSAERTAQKNQIAFEGLFNPLVYPIEPLAAAGVITGNEAYSRKAADGLVNMARSLNVHSPQIDCGFYFTRTFYVRALALGYDWLHAFLTPEERRDIQATLLGFVLDIYEKSFQQHWGRHPLQRVWNWDPGLASCAGLGMLALEGETTAPENAILFAMRRHLKDYLTLGIDSDGACMEGPSYINYGIGAGTLFMEVLRQQRRGDLFTETNAQLIAPWLAYEMLPGRKNWNNLGDCNFGQPPAGQFYIYAMGRYAELAMGEKANAASEKLPVQEDMTAGLDYLQHFPEAPGKRLLSYHALAQLMSWNMHAGALGEDPTLMSAQLALVHALTFRDYPELSSPERVLPQSRLFHGRGLVVSRSGFGADSLHLAIEAGPHAAGHDQSDKGSFTLRAYGQDFFIDSGYGNDSNPLKSSGPFAHNLVLVDGEGQPCRAHNNSSGNITGYRHSAQYDWVRVDALDAWNVTMQGDFTAIPTGRNMKRAVRQFVLVRPQDEAIPPYLVVYDDICKADDAPHDFTWLWHFGSDMSLTQKNGVWELRPNRDCPTVLTSTQEHKDCTATFRFKAPTDGDYKLAGLTAAMGKVPGMSDSFALSVNGQEIACWDIKSSASLVWCEVKKRGALEPYRIAAKAGDDVTVVLKAREPEAGLAKLSLVSYGAALPLSPADTPRAGQTLAAAEAEQGERPFVRQAFRRAGGSEALVNVFPVGTPEGAVRLGWFETSHDGAHPRLEHSVMQTANPHFLMVIVPRRQAGVQLPQVQRLGQGGVSVKWQWRTDRIELTESLPRVEFAAAGQ